nr:hypothetical protein [Cressdnaviricota sp.]
MRPLGGSGGASPRKKFFDLLRLQFSRWANRVVPAKKHGPHKGPAGPAPRSAPTAPCTSRTKTMKTWTIADVNKCRP